MGAIIEIQERHQWAQQITQRFNDSVQAIIDTGRMLIQAKESLPHGEFAKLFENGEVPFSDRSGQMFMTIASHSIISNTNHGSVLPNSWRTLYELTKAPEDKLQEWISEGKITPETQRKDIESLLKTCKSTSQHKSEEQNASEDQDIKGEPFAKVWTGNMEWYTPEQYIDSARHVMGEIDLDPASNDFAQNKIKAKAYYTEDIDGLLYDWHGRIWLNPPYKMPAVKDFIVKLVDHYLLGDISEAILLTNNATDTSWWHLAAKASACICFTSGRISFYNETGEHSAPTNGQNFFYFGPNKEIFITEFSKYGLVMEISS